MSKIEWTHRQGTKSEVLNPTTGCDKVTRGCRNCYAEVMHKRLRGMGQPKYQQPFLGHVKFWPDELAKPFGWKKPRTVFLNSMSDIFHKDITVRQIAEIYAMMALTNQHTYIVLTKRADRACEILNSAEFLVEFNHAMNRLHSQYINQLSECLYFQEETDEMFPMKNVWQGVSVENIEQEDRVTHLINTPANVRVLSIEPMVGAVSVYRAVRKWHNTGTYTNPIFWDGTIEQFNFWVIAGGESGNRADPCHPDWIRSLRDECKKEGVPFFFKQWGEWWPGEKGRLYHKKTMDFTDGQSMVKVGKQESGNYLDGVQHLEFPA